MEPEEAEQPDPGAEPTASEPVAEPAAESGALHDADPPTEALPPAVGDAPVEPPEQAGEPESAGPGELHDADPPTEPEGEEVESDELPRLGDEELEKALEALLLVVDSPVEEDVLANAVGAELVRVTETLGRMATTLAEHERGFDLRRAGGGWRFYTRDKYAPYVEKMLLDGQRAKLTRAALETLAVIAYRQPVTRARVAAVRGVNCDGVIRTLLARGLVEETGTDVETGGFLYRTTELFLERLGLSSLEDLPPIAPLLPEVDAIDDV
ncbi:MAG TPA: SMC-Scp complex subunit ScpB [Actinophytocola sp.]